jgi:hypothetical protein
LDDLKKNSFTSDTFISIDISLDICHYNTSSCIVNDELYKSISEKSADVSFCLNFPNSFVDPDNYEQPLRFTLKPYLVSFNTSQLSLIRLNQVELNTHSPSIFKSLTTESYYFSTDNTDISLRSDINGIKFNLYIIFDPYGFTKIIYTRSYKSVSAALAGTFSIVKPYIIVFGFINKTYCKSQMKNDIIDRCFNYKAVVKTNDSGEPNLENLQVNLKENINENKPVKKRTVFLFPKQKICLKGLFCRRLTFKDEFYFFL